MKIFEVTAKETTPNMDKVLTALKKKLKDEGGAAGFDPLKAVAKTMDVNLTPAMLKGMSGIKMHRDGDYILEEAKEEMCPEACCGKPIKECKCGPDCKHCDCHAKNKMNEASTLPPMKKELENLIRNVMSPEDGKKAFYAWIGLNRAANSNVIDGSFSRNRKTLQALIQKYNSGGKKGGIFKPGAKSVQVPFDRKRKDLGGNAGVSETATVGGTSAGDVSVITSVPGAKRKVGKGKNGLPKAPQATNADGTAKNALDMTANVMGGKAIKR